MSAFAESAGKYILGRRKSDVAVREHSATEYYKNIQLLMGGDNANVYSPCYIAPAVNHCYGDVGPSETTQLLPALDKWVQSVEAPSTLIALDKVRKFSRPLCAFPDYARYSGKGNSLKAESFVCVKN